MPGSGLTQGTARFDPAGGLQSLGVGTDDKKVLDKGKTVDPRSDGLVGWGRWTDGESKVNDASGRGKGPVATLHYFVFGDSPVVPVSGVFNAFGSTAPTVTSGGKLVATGVVDSATGSVTATMSTSGGSANYRLVVPVPGQTFTLAGVATQTSLNGFSGSNSTITSTGTGCSGGCTGTLVNGASVIGTIGGSAGNRVGVGYGFDSRIGNVTGVIVFKR